MIAVLNCFHRPLKFLKKMMMLTQQKQTSRCDWNKPSSEFLKDNNLWLPPFHRFLPLIFLRSNIRVVCTLIVHQGFTLPHNATLHSTVLRHSAPHRSTALRHSAPHRSHPPAPGTAFDTEVSVIADQSEKTFMFLELH